MDSFTVAEEEVGQRLDRVLCARFGLSRSRVRLLLEAGAVRRNDRRARKGEVVDAGDCITVSSLAGAVELAARPDPSVPVVVRYEDEHLAVLDKPAGIPSHPLRPGELGCLANGVIARYPETAALGYDVRQPGLINRLDNDTSGLVLIARCSEAFARLRAQLAAGKIHKRYLALVACAVEPQRIELPLRASERGPRVEAVADQDAGSRRADSTSRGRPSRTQVLGCREVGVSRYLVEVDAGRAYRHQVRVHLAAIGAPIVGDALYGGEPAARHHLHASHVSFVHPFTGLAVAVDSPLPTDWPL